MAFEIQKEEKPVPFTSDRALYLNADKSEVVEAGSPDAAFLLVGAGSEIPDEEAARYGLKSAKKVEDKQAGPEADKSLDDMTKAELLAEAERRGVEVKSSATKAEILDALGG